MMRRVAQSVSFRLAALLLVALLIPLTLGGCNTVDGFGQDLEETGENISNAAKEVKK